jgi:hypothetical protein
MRTLISARTRRFVYVHHVIAATLAVDAAPYVATSPAPSSDNRNITPAWAGALHLVRTPFALAGNTICAAHALVGVCRPTGRIKMQMAHTRAAEHHERAAKSHRAAAEQHGKDNHVKGNEHSTEAHKLSKTAHEHTELAHGKSTEKK